MYVSSFKDGIVDSLRMYQLVRISVNLTQMTTGWQFC